jgi:curved DNA-binding protein CbpA
MNEHYKTLELPDSASPRRIKEQYRRLAKRYHPDRTTNPEEKARFAEKFREINAAYEALADIVQRGNLAPLERRLDFLYRQGLTLIKEKKWSQAMMVFNEVIATDPTYKDTWSYLRDARRKYKLLAALYETANSQFAAQNWGEAMAAFEEVLREDPAYRDAARKFKRARRERLMEDFMSQY